MGAARGLRFSGRLIVVAALALATCREWVMGRDVGVRTASSIHFEPRLVRISAPSLWAKVKRAFIRGLIPGVSRAAAPLER